MADEKEQPTPRKRAPRKKPPAVTDADAVAEAEASSVAEENNESTGREVVTATSVLESAAAEPAAETAEAPQPEVTQRDLNRTVLGALTLHTPTRDVVVVLDGESAARVMAVFAGTVRRHSMQDLMHPAASEMRHLWLSVDLSDVVALSWMPGLPTGGERVMTVDPPVPEAMAR